MKRKCCKIVGVDFDDTLVDEVHSIKSRWEKVLEKFSYLHPDLRSVFFKIYEEKGREYKKHVNDTLQALQLDEGMAEKMVESFLTAPSKEKLLDGVMNLISFLKAKGCKICILTGGKKAHQEARIKKAGLYELVDAVFYGDEYHKPDKTFFTKSMESFGLENPEEFIYVGNDLKFDIIPAVSLGINTYWLTNDNNAENPKSVQVANMAELLNKLKEIDF